MSGFSNEIRGAEGFSTEQSGMDESGVDEFGLDEFGMDEFGVEESGTNRTGTAGLSMDGINMDGINMDGTSMDGAGADRTSDPSPAFDGTTTRVMDPGASTVSGEDERTIEVALRPKRLVDFPGQPRVRDQLGLVLLAAKQRGAAPDHVLLSGPPGLGKTTLAMIVAAELERPIRVTSGPAIQHAGDLASILSSLDEGEVLFLDEIHRMSRAAEEMLYLAMEDFRVDVIVGKGPGATAIPLDLPPFTVVGATTRAGLLPAPLRDRFGFTGHLDYYDVADLTTILRRSAGLLDVRAHDDAIVEIARRSRGTPRIANRLLRRVRDYAQVHHAPGHRVTRADAREALTLFDVDELGLDRLDRAVLGALCHRFAGGPVGLSTLAIAVGEETDTVETVAEPFLVREGFMARSPRGRVATALAFTHLGLQPPLTLAGGAPLPGTTSPTLPFGEESPDPPVTRLGS